MLSENFGRHLDSIVLVVNCADNHRLEDQIGLARVGVRLCEPAISQ